MVSKKKDWENCEKCIYHKAWQDTGSCPFAYSGCDGKKMFTEREK